MMAFLRKKKDGPKALHYTVANLCQLYLEQGKWEKARTLAKLQISRVEHLRHSKNIFF
jgi:hypothetical protein